MLPIGLLIVTLLAVGSCTTLLVLATRRRHAHDGVATKKQHKIALQTWENEGGSPAPGSVNPAAFTELHNHTRNR